MIRFFGATVLSAALLVPAAIAAQDRNDHQSKRYYDSTHKDYHEWNANEDQQYHRYVKENNKREQDWSKASKKDRNGYWNWRHEHPDSH